MGSKKVRKKRRLNRFGKPVSSNWGGKRPGAGRKPKGLVAGVSHRERAAYSPKHPAHVTLKLREQLPRLRQKAEYAAILAAFGLAKERFGFRLCHYAVLDDQIQLIVEATSRAALRSGLQGLAIRTARGLNRLWRRKGKLFADRYHQAILKTPADVRQALAQVVRHPGPGARAAHVLEVYSSAPWFDGFRPQLAVRGLEDVERPLADARSRLLRVEWRRHGLLSPQDDDA